ncbi:MAG TPA: biotin/lipoyl-containing protein [Candidatus Limnocylindrales bacterium]|nr:biotin/lipoyl-containing protein [Candidatus Limnocylindrales bacterium]
MRRYTVAIDDRAFTIDVQETSSDTFEVTVDGLTFEATLRGDHDLPGSDISPEIPMIETARPKGPRETVPEAAPEAHPAPRTTAARGAPPPAGTPGRERIDVMTAPMPGVVLEVHVTAGAALKRGDPVLVLEAMKMRNTIRSPRDAVILEVAVEAGQPVASGALLARLGDAPG